MHDESCLNLFQKEGCNNYLTITKLTFLKESGHVQGIWNRRPVTQRDGATRREGLHTNLEVARLFKYECALRKSRRREFQHKYIFSCLFTSKSQFNELIIVINSIFQFVLFISYYKFNFKIK